MAYRRKRRSRGTWFPTFGIETGEEQDQVTVAGRRLDLTVDSNGQPVIEVVDLTLDFPRDNTDDPAITGSLADTVGSEWFLKRIVGKCFLNVFREADNIDIRGALISAGFFVGRADPDGANPLGISVMAAGDAFNSYSPLAQQTMREPWIWRRSWILQDTNPTSGQPQGFPQANARYGSVSDGPHIDAKTKRAIGQDDRLYFALAATRWPVGISTESDVVLNVECHLDYRLFGNLRKSRQKGAF